jgi:hypothetical protein
MWGDFFVELSGVIFVCLCMMRAVLLPNTLTNPPPPPPAPLPTLSCVQLPVSVCFPRAFGYCTSPPPRLASLPQKPRFSLARTKDIFLGVFGTRDVATRSTSHATRGAT